MNFVMETDTWAQASGLSSFSFFSQDIDPPGCVMTQPQFYLLLCQIACVWPVYNMMHVFSVSGDEYIE